MKEVGVGRGHGQRLADGLLDSAAPREEGGLHDEVDARQRPQEVVNAEVAVPIVVGRGEEDGAIVGDQADVAEMYLK